MFFEEAIFFITTSITLTFTYILPKPNESHSKVATYRVSWVKPKLHRFRKSAGVTLSSRYADPSHSAPQDKRTPA